VAVSTYVVSRDTADQILEDLFVARLLALTQCSGHSEAQRLATLRRGL
jgi:hypothetical protein